LFWTNQNDNKTEKYFLNLKLNPILFNMKIKLWWNLIFTYNK